MNKYDVCILGGGAAGLAAAATLSDDLKVCVLEKNQRPGRKIMASGGGRCNITNASASGVQGTIEFFRNMGLELHCDADGRYYPYSNQAADVVEILLASIRKKNTQIYTEFSAGSVSAEGGNFCISDGNKVIVADRLIIATGGKSYPELGTTGDGFVLARKLGHKVERVYPILAPVECEHMPDLKGIRAQGTARLLKDGRVIDSESGEIQFTTDGLSGICIFNLTMNMKAEDGEQISAAMKRYEISLDLAPDFSLEQLKDRETSFGIVTGRLAEVVKPQQLKDFRFHVQGVKGWKSAQCTAGGVSLDELNMATMESKVLPGLYFAGEVVNIQYKCGGFNLQNAWETGRLAAEAINRELS